MELAIGIILLLFAVLLIALVLVTGGVGLYLAARGSWRAIRADLIRDRGGEPKRAWVMIVSGLALVSFDVVLLWALSKLDLNMTKGRLLRLDGRVRLPKRTIGSAPMPAIFPSLTGLSSWERAGLTELWLHSARMEQASVPAFSLLSLKLMALGAPLELNERALHAGLDETDHARRCYALARAYSGVPWTAGSIPELASPKTTAPERDRALSLARLAAGALRDGCLAEGVAARVAAEGAELASDPVVRETLRTIARDERVHAELGWDVVRFCLDEGGEPVTRALASAVAALSERLAPRVPRIPGLSEEFLSRHGRPSEARLDELARGEVRAVEDRAGRLIEPPRLRYRFFQSSSVSAQRS
jgi:hypothetical protein